MEIIIILCENELKKDKEYKWKIKILNTKQNKINIGIVPMDFDYNSSQPYKLGWYIYCFDLTLYSGPPHNYCGKETKLKPPKREIMVYMNMRNRILKFKIDNEGKEEECYNDIPIDKPIAPSVTLYNKNDSVEIISYS